MTNVQFPVVLNCRDHLTYLAELGGPVQRGRPRRHHVPRQRHSYEPLLEWHAACPHRVVMLGRNLARTPHGLRDTSDAIKRYWFVVSDPDVLPKRGCLLDAVDGLRRMFRRHQLMSKIALSLKLDDCRSAL